MAFGKTVQNSTKTEGDVCIHECPGTISVYKRLLTFINLDSKRFAAQISNIIYDHFFFAVSKYFNGNSYSYRSKLKSAQKIIAV